MFKLRHLLLAGALLAAMKSNACHVDYYVSYGCLGATSVTIDAYQVATSGNTGYQWQYRAPGGNWTFFSTTSSTQTIKNQLYNISGTHGVGVDNPDLVISKTASSTMENLDGVEVRVLLRVDGAVNNNTGVGNSNIDIYNGDDESKDLAKILRLTYNPTACGTSCLNNLITNSNGYYGGFEQVGYSNGDFTDNNWGPGEGDSDLPMGSGSNGYFKVLNNPYAFSTSFPAFAPHSGNYQMVVKGSNSTSTRAWYQSVAVTSGYQYTFSVWVARVNGTYPNLKLMANSTEIGSLNLSSSYDAGEWVQITGTYNATSSTNVVFSIKNDAASSGTDYWTMDDICIVKEQMIDIGDFVWFDVNRNGIQDAGEPGVSGVTVQLFPDANNDGNGDNGTTPYATATTNASGNYLFTVPRGEYFVKFTLPSGYTAFTTQNAGTAGTNSAVDANGKTGTHNFTADYLMKDAGVVKNITISGNAFNDPDALTDNTVDGTAISAAAAALYANLFKTVGSTNSFVASVALSGGAYTFSNLPGNTNYTVAISTVAATAATTTPSSVLTGGYANTGENIGTAAGNDGTANGIIAVSLAAANIANVNFGMQTPPTANVVTLPSQANPGGNTFITVPATNFGGTDAGGGSLSFIKITGFPTNATAIKINGTDYTAGNIGIAPNVPTNAAGQPTQAIAVDPVDGNVSVVIPYKTIDNGGAQSSNTGSVTVPVVMPPDLSPLIAANPSTMNGITDFNITIKVSEVGGGTATNGLITVLVPKDPRVSFTYNSAMTVIGSTAVNNANWTLDNSNQFFYKFTSTTVIPAGGFSTIGLAAQFNPQSAQGVYVLSSVIASGSGGEVRTSNNSSSVSLTYFPN